MKKRSRIFNIMQYEKHPETQELLLSEDTIKNALLSHRTITRWAYIKHDKDVYSALDEEQDENHKQGQIKPAHWHIVLELRNNAIEIGVIAKWFKIKDNYVNVAKGAGAFLDCVQYLTHERDEQQQLGKRLYEDIKVKANFEFRKELDLRSLRKAKYGRDVSIREELRLKVLHGEMTLAEVKKEYELEYIVDSDMLRKMRIEFIQNATPPALRHNFYICGDGGIGKGVASKYLAHALYPDIEPEDKLIFWTGSDNTTFDGYDGQPVIIWDDCRSYDLLKKLGSRGNVFRVFDTSPHKQNQNVKFGAVNLINNVNIVNSVQPFEEFLNGLVGEYKDRDGEEHYAEDKEKAQSYRRFPFIMPLRANDFDILINRAYMNGEGNYDEYIRHLNIIGNFAKLVKNAPPGSIDVVNVATGMVHPLVEARDEKEKQQKLLESNENELDFSEYGKVEKIDVGNIKGEELSDEPPF